MTPVMPNTKIVATIGPSSQNKKQFKSLVESGVSIARLNMSHGSHDYHAETIKNVRSVEKEVKKPLAILLDLAGPKIRIGDFEKDQIELIPGREFILTIENVVGTEKKVYINYPKIVKEIKPGMTLLLDDGKKSLVVKSVNTKEVITKVVVGGVIKSRRGVNIPGANLSINTITAKDIKDVDFAIAQKVDFIALSFVRRSSDITELRKIIDKKKGTQKIIAKIETPEALDDIEKIIKLTDAVMVARGDLAIEIGPERVPREQKRIINLCRSNGKPVITATQMLESMTTRPVPSRAEVSDIANAIFDGTDAVMLSEETAMGSYPIEAVSVMQRVIVEAEKDNMARDTYTNTTLIQNAVTNAVSEIAESTMAKGIVALTETGSTAKLVSMHRTITPIFGVTPYIYIARQLALSFGVIPKVLDHMKDVESTAVKVISILLKDKEVKKGDKLVFSAGTPIGEAGSTNTLMVRNVK
jgi:pyruvate kinase